MEFFFQKTSLQAGVVHPDCAQTIHLFLANRQRLSNILYSGVCIAQPIFSFDDIDSDYDHFLFLRI